MPDGVRFRPVDSSSEAEVRLVAERMRETLVEVLGAERGRSMYTLDWLEQRVRWHLDASAVTGAVFVAESGGAVVGHTIVRVEAEDEGGTVGLFSTTYVEGSARRQGIASELVARGEDWMGQQEMRRAVTYTDVRNAGLIRLFEGRGYLLHPMPNDFVRLERGLATTRS